MKRCLLPVAFLGLLVIPTNKLQAQFTVSDPPVEYETLAMHLQQLQQYIKEAAIAINTYEHLQLMIREVQQLAQHPSTNIAYDFATFTNILQQSQALAIGAAQMDVIFQQKFAPYSATPVANYALQYANWAQTTLNGLHAAAMAGADQGAELQNEQAFMQQMNLMNQQTNGMDESLQIANALQLEQIAQNQRLRMLILASNQQNAMVASTTLNAQQAGVNAQAQIFTDLGVSADQRGW